MAKRQPEILIDDDVPPNWVGAKAEADAAKAARMADLVYMVAIFVVVYCSGTAEQQGFYTKASEVRDRSVVQTLNSKRRKIARLGRWIDSID